MIKKFIKAGTPGTFRPGHGEYPETDTRIDLWVSVKGVRTLISNAPSSGVQEGYAWQYAPTPPTVDDFEAFKQAWSDGPDLIGGHGYRYYPANGLLIDGYNINPQERKLGDFTTLELAQKAAYAHFLQSLNDPTE